MKNIKLILSIFIITILCSCVATDNLWKSAKPSISSSSKITLINTFQNSFNSSTAVNGIRYNYSGNNKKCLDENNIISLGTPPWGRYTMVNQYKNFLFSFQPQQKIDEVFKKSFKDSKILHTSFTDDLSRSVLDGFIATKNNQNIEDISKYSGLLPVNIPSDSDYVIIAYPNIGSELSIRDPYGVDHSYARAIGFGGYFNDRSVLGSVIVGLFSNISKPFSFANADKIHFNMGILVFDAKQKKFVKYFRYINEFDFASDTSELHKALFDSSTKKEDIDRINHMCEFSDAQIGVIDHFMQGKINEILKKVVDDIAKESLQNQN